MILCVDDHCNDNDVDDDMVRWDQSCIYVC